MNIDAYNCLTPDEAAVPKYTPNPKFRCIKVYYADENDVIIVGEADPNFIYWLSVTKMDDIQTNRMIVGYLLRMEPELFGHDSVVIEKKTKYTYEQLRSFYMVQISSADEILTRYQEAKRNSSSSQEAEQKRLAEMKKQLQILSRRGPDPVEDYERKKQLILKIRSQSKLRLSDNAKIRNLYERLDKLCSDIYNEYMTAAR